MQSNNNPALFAGHLNKIFSKSNIVYAVLLLTFFMSGSAALIYQVSWQRYLFIGLGVDIDSVTIIVSAFMLGLGLGGWLGGFFADKFSKRRIHFYAFIELILGLIGYFSTHISSFIQWMNAAGMPYAAISLICLSMLLVPTMLMGMTLPILTIEFDDHLKNIGNSIGSLYFFNTIGAAFGAWLVAYVLFAAYGISGTVKIASLINMTCCARAILSLYSFLKLNRHEISQIH